MDDTSAWDAHDRRVALAMGRATSDYVEGGLQGLLVTAANYYLLKEAVTCEANNLMTQSQHFSNLLYEANQWVSKNRTDRSK